jgi:hypothetical protein
MSRAPIIRGYQKICEAERIGEAYQKIIVMPWIVKNRLYISGASSPFGSRELESHDQSFDPADKQEYHGSRQISFADDLVVHRRKQPVDRLGCFPDTE